MLNLGLNLGLTRNAGGILSAYKLAGLSPSYVMDATNAFYYAGATKYSGVNQMHTVANASNSTVVDGDGLIKWAPHNLIPYSDDVSQ